jgi:RNA polymerase sigma-70 factor (ECF subfamily)
VDEVRTAREAIFSAAFEAHYVAIFQYARRRTSSDSEAEESVAEVFLTAWRRIDALPSEPATRPWLYGVARRIVANRRRSVARRLRLIDRLRLVLHAAVPGTSETRSDLEPVLRALARLSETDREVLRLVAWEELSRAEIATVLGLTTANVSVRLHRARNRLARELDRLPLGAPSSAGHLQGEPPISVAFEEDSDAR